MNEKECVEILKQIVDVVPKRMDGGLAPDYYYCPYCCSQTEDIFGSWEISMDEIAHSEDCLYLKAKKLLESHKHG